MNSPKVAVIGTKDGGKTRLIEALTRELSKRGYKVETVKHIPHTDFTIDTPNTDTWRHAQAGARTVVAVSPHEIVVIRKALEADASLDEALKLTESDEVDIVIIEGFKRQIKDRLDIPKIVVLKSKDDVHFLDSQKNVIMAVTDTPEDYNLNLPCFTYEEIKRIVDILEAIFKKK